MTDKGYLFHHLERVHAGKYAGFRSGQYFELWRKKGEWRLVQKNASGRMVMVDQPRFRTLKEARDTIERDAQHFAGQS